MALTPTVYLGAAGTGKTYHLIDATRAYAEGVGIRSGQKVLGLTFMHGSRRRMIDRLADLNAEGIPTQVETLDSFALRIVRRFRRHCGLGGGEIFAINEEGASTDWIERHGARHGSYDRIRSEAAVLLSIPAVAATLRTSHPLILIDEAQDCRGTLLLLVQALSAAVQLVCAADPFQDLAQQDESSPVVEWLRGRGNVVDLTAQHRTNARALLYTASALRHGTSCTAGVEVLGMKGSGLAAYEIQCRTTNTWRGQVALISPVAPERNRWVDEVLRFLHNHKAKGKIRPAPFTWEATNRASESALVAEITAHVAHDDTIAVDELKAARDLPEISAKARRVFDSVLRRMRLSGAVATSASELSEVARRAASAERTRGTADEGTFRRAMTVHGAKNREFDYVFVLWPYGVPSGEVTQRKLLYNAITRARRDAVVLAQGGERRVNHDPMLSRIARRQQARSAR
jgi:superfamily I DNA/RNA helicase